jgi:hypothetical protein
MTNQLAVILGALIVGFFLLDGLVLETGATLFFARKIADLAVWLAFWR